MINLPKSVAICAMSKTGQLDVSDYEYVIGINNTHVEVDINPDLIIAMDDLKRDEKVEPGYVDAIVNKGCPVLSTRKFRKWPNVQPYPIKEVSRFLEKRFRLPACKLLDCSISFALALCISQTVAKIGLSGIDLTPPYDPMANEIGMVVFKYKGYPKAPSWFQYYSQEALSERRPREPGWESIHTFIGYGLGIGIDFEWGRDTTILNMDRDNYLYGYTTQPRVR